MSGFLSSGGNVSADKALKITGTRRLGYVLVPSPTDASQATWVPVGTTDAPVRIPVLATRPPVAQYPVAGALIGATDTGVLSFMTGAASASGVDNFITPNAAGVNGLSGRPFDDSGGLVWGSAALVAYGYTDLWTVTPGVGAKGTSSNSAGAGATMGTGPATVTATIDHQGMAAGTAYRVGLYLAAPADVFVWLQIRMNPAPFLTIHDGVVGTTSGATITPANGIDVFTLSFDGTTITASRAGVNGTEQISMAYTKAMTSAVTGFVKDESTGTCTLKRFSSVSLGTLAWKP